MFFCQRVGYFGETFDETTIVWSESEKWHKIFHVTWQTCILSILHFDVVRVYTVLVNELSERFYSGLHEEAFWQPCAQSMLLLQRHHSFQVANMFFPGRRVHENIINVTLHVVEIHQDTVHHPLKWCLEFLKPKGISSNCNVSYLHMSVAFSLHESSILIFQYPWKGTSVVKTILPLT